MAEQSGAEQAFAALVASMLGGSGRLRVWSVIISIFGDLVVPRGGRLPGTVLSALTERLGIGPGAVRTALSRLGTEGWLIRDRNGRTVVYRLTAEAIPQFDLAARTIYAATRPVPNAEPALLVLPERVEPGEHASLLAIRRGVWLWIGPGPVPEEISANAIVCAGGIDTLPGWARAAVAPPALAGRMSSLVRAFDPLDRALDAGAVLAPVDAAAARALLIHVWRRVALRHPPVPDRFLPRDWPEPSCRCFVRALHAKLGLAAAPWLEETLPAPETLGPAPV